MSNWKIISRKNLINSKFFEVEKEKVKLPNGNIHIYETVIRRPTVMIIPLTNDYELYLIRQYRHMLNDYAIEFAAGHIDDGEKALFTAKRELKEETGLTARHWEEIGRVEGSASVIQSKLHYFLAKELEEGESEPEEGEEIELIKISFKKAVEMVLSGKINNLPTMYGILLLEKLVKEKRL